MTDEGSRASDDGANRGEGVAADERAADAVAAGGDGATAEGAREMDPEMADVVEYELEDLEGEEELPYPSMDDPVAPQSIDLENAAFVVLGVVATVGLVAHMILGIL